MMEAGGGWQQQPERRPEYKVVPHDDSDMVTGQQAMLDNAVNFYMLLYCEKPIHAAAQASACRPTAATGSCASEHSSRRAAAPERV